MMEARTPQEFFDQILPLRFKPERTKGISVIVQVNITGSMGGDWTIEIDEQKLRVMKGNFSLPNLTVAVRADDFLEIVNDKLSAQKAFFMGKIKFKGDIALALKLRDAGFL
jgi:putative sterol carrier protein